MNSSILLWHRNFRTLNSLSHKDIYQIQYNVYLRNVLCCITYLKKVYYYFDFPIVTFMLFLDTDNLATLLGASASFLVITTMGLLFPLLLFRAVIQK